MHTDRFIVKHPDGLDPTLAQAAQDAGAWAMIDASHADASDTLARLDPSRTLLRVTPEDPVTPGVGMAVIAPWRIAPEHVPGLAEAIDAWQAAGVPVAVEARTPAEGRRAKDAGADLLVARGGEGPGRASPLSNLVLLPSLAELELPVIAWGGAGPNATGALLVHADAVVLDAQLYLLPEANLPEPWQRTLSAFGGGDVRSLGDTLEEPFYAMARPADEHVHEAWQAEQASEDGPATRRRAIRETIDEERADWSADPGSGLAPLGHDAAHASFFEAFDNLEAALEWLLSRVEQQLDEAGFPLTEGGPLAQAHGTRYPIVQGAMANVSEVPAFAKAVADAGALPFLAFAALREGWAREAMEGTLEALDDDQAFGCGIIGLDVNAEKRDAHLRLIEEHQPPYALIAAGTAEQALAIQDAGVATYMHTPSRGIVRQAVEMGLSRIVVEGNECGGHIGKLPSLVLWDQTLQELEAQDLDREVNVLLAGGISDEAAAAMAGTLAAGAPARVGALMGTAYLATEEIVETGAIPETYQDLVLATQETEVTGGTVGIRARSAPTPFTDHLTELEQRLLKEGVELDERKQTFEHENLGATRLAARGLRRGDDGSYHEVELDEQLAEGNFLMGQGAQRIEQRTTLDELHRRVTEDAQRIAEGARDRLAGSFALPSIAAETTRSSQEAIAVVGLGCILPEATSVDAFWSNLMDGRVSIRELPEGRWPTSPEIHHRPDEPDGTYTLLGAFVEEDPFDPIEHRIPPTVAEQMDPAQRWAVEATGQALEDAGLLDVEDRDRWSVILGNAQGEARTWSDRRLGLREALDALDQAGLDEAARREAKQPLEAMLDELPPITEDTMPGELSNVTAGRVCSVFDIGGPARTVDTACASSLAACEEAVRGLRDGDVDVAITGGVDHSMGPSAYTKFSAIGALSREGSYPFSEQASGFVMGEGCGILVLKRLEDAARDGDRVYAVIEGVASSSDGAGKGITAPNPSGQARAIQRAWDDAQLDPSTLAFVEAHGTGTPVGDPVEAGTLEELLEGTEAGPVALGSVKANIGHLKTAAGAAGLLKAVLAIHHRTLPPTPVDSPTDAVDWEASPLLLATTPVDLPADRIRAGVSAFGFGGTNSHVVLAAPPSEEVADPVPEPAPQASARALELEAVSGQDRKAVAAQVANGPGSSGFDASDPVRLAMRKDADPEVARKVLAGELPPELALSKGIGLAEGETGQLGLVFPGQGSQYPGMVLDLAEHHPAAREVLEQADQVLTPLIGRPLSEILALEGEAGQAALTPTEVCQPAVLTADIAVLRVLEELGVEPDVVAGHSLGEYAALVAADVISFGDALHAVSARGREMADVEVDDPGGLIALKADADEARELIEGLDAWPANLNGPEQTVVAGTTPALETIEARADEAGIKASRLPVSAAFHSPIVAPARDPLRKVLDRIPIDPPSTPVIANATADPYPEEPDAIRERLAEQVESPVRWTETMHAFEAAGVDLIVEAGPKRVLAMLAQANLPGTLAVPTADPRTGAKESFERALVALAAHGHLPLGGPDPRRSPRQATPPREGPPSPTVTHDGEGSPTRQERGRPSIVVSGVSVGLPTPNGEGDPFDPEALEALLAGENRIGPVPDDERETMASLGITRLVKDGPSGPTLEPISDPEDVVRLAGRTPEVDLASYDADPDWLATADPTARLAVAAALEALTDARIPLVPDERETSTGTTLTDGWQLPEPLQAETGVILASAFPGDASLVEAVQDAAAKQRERSSDPSVIIDAVNRLSEHLDTPEGQTELLDWVTDAHAAAPASIEAPKGDGFPRDLLFRALAMGHAQVAQLIGAMGPNLQVNAACASTTAAIAMAQDWIEQGRAERVIVVGADVAGNEALLPWIGGGFLAAGAATTEEAVEEAALPFDERRHGMLVGSGAVGLVLETRKAAQARGLEPLAELVEAHTANSAYHGARLDPDHVAEQVDTVLDRAAARLDRDPDQLAKDLVFVSHEPATPARGGSAEAEVQALRRALGEAAGEVLITNTKGLTGHAMGAGIEDGIAVELLRARQAPPVANLEQVDPDFADLTFSQGQPTERDLALRFAAGFGSQVAMALFHRTSATPGQLDEARFADWLETTVGPGFEARQQERLLRALPVETGQAPTAGSDPVEATVPSTPATDGPARAAPASDEATGSKDQDATPEPVEASTAEVRELLTRLVSVKTGYPEDVIEPEMDLEADLGVDTVKQAEVLSEARSELDIPPIEGMSLSDVPTLDQAAELLAQHAGPDGTDPATTSTVQETAPAEDEPGRDPATPAPTDGAEAPSSSELDVQQVRKLLTELVSAKTGYPTDVIEPGMDLEADLGVDTVKQAEVLSEARSELDIPPIEGMSLSDVPTLDQAAELLAEHADSGPSSQEDTGASLPPPAEDVSGTPEPSMRVLEVRTAPAPAAEPLPEGTRVHLQGAVPDGLASRLADHGARLDEASPELVVHALDIDEVDPASVTEQLSKLQATATQDVGLVLLAPAKSPIATGLGPLAGTLAEEEIPSRAVLVEPRVPLDRLARELLLDTTTSVTLSPDHRRSPTLAAQPDEAERELELPEGATVLAPGGLGAAVVPCLERLAEDNDVRIAVAGRSPIEDPGIDPDDEDAVDQLRARLLEEAKQADGPVRPAEVERRVEAVLKRARRARAFDRLDAVAEVRYDRLDATDPDALDAWVDAVDEAWDTPALVVHGTGVERSRGFLDKEADEMQLVLAAKLVPVRELARRLPDAHHVAFGSIAGVTGNPGQADYALANGTLEALLAPVDGTVLHWTAWDAPGGMADDETVRAVLEDRDVTFLDPEEGAERFLTWAGAPGARAIVDLAPTRSLDATAGSLELTGEEAWLLDHQVGDRPLVPGVRYLQAIAEVAGHDEMPPRALHAVRFERPAWVTEPTSLGVDREDGELRVIRDGTLLARARPGPGDGTKPVPTDPVEGASLGKETIYERLFHGPSFQVLDQATLAEGRVSALADLSAGGAAPWALALEAGLQAAGLAGEGLALPVGIEALELGPDPGQAAANVNARRVSDDLMGSVWDVRVEDAHGEMIVQARGARLQQADGLTRWTDATTELSRRLDASLSVRPVEPHEPRDPRAKRGADRAAGSAAAEAALTSAHGEPVDVARDDEGRPHPVDAAGGVSITHGHGVAVAAAHPGVEAIGVDLERVEPRSDAWLGDHFTEAEIERVEAHELTREAAATLVWTLKEAASKALGTGLDLPAASLEVVLEGEAARVLTPDGPFAGRWVEVGDAFLTVVTPENGA